MSDENSTESFAYILIVESDKELRESVPNTDNLLNCAIDVAMDEDEAVYKAQQHRRAHLSRAVRLVTHSDVAFTIRSKVIWYPSNFPLCSRSKDGQTFSDPEEVILIRPSFRDQAWRKEWYAYSGSQRGMDFLSDHIPYWLGWTPDPPFPKNPESCLRRWKWGWIFSQTIFHKRMSETFLN